MNYEEFEIIFNSIKQHKEEIFIEIDKKQIIENYKDNPDELIKILKNVKNYKPIKEIKNICGLNCKNNIITFILNNFNF